MSCVDKYQGIVEVYECNYKVANKLLKNKWKLLNTHVNPEHEEVTYVVGIEYIDTMLGDYYTPKQAEEECSPYKRFDASKYDPDLREGE